MFGLCLYICMYVYGATQKFMECKVQNGFLKEQQSVEIKILYFLEVCAMSNKTQKMLTNFLD